MVDIADKLYERLEAVAKSLVLNSKCRAALGDYTSFQFGLLYQHRPLNNQAPAINLACDLKSTHQPPHQGSFLCALAKVVLPSRHQLDLLIIKTIRS